MSFLEEIQAAAIDADNITDEDALTEGDPRDFMSRNCRPIMPQSVKFSVGYAI